MAGGVARNAARSRPQALCLAGTSVPTEEGLSFQDTARRLYSFCREGTLTVTLTGPGASARVGLEASLSAWMGSGEDALVGEAGGRGAVGALATSLQAEASRTPAPPPHCSPLLGPHPGPTLVS